MPRLLARHGWLIAIAVAYLYVFPYFPHVNSANELPRLYLVKAIADDQGFAIEHQVQHWTHWQGGGRTADITQFHGHDYSNKAPGSSMLAVPPYLVARLVAGEPDLPATMWISRVFAGVIPMLLFLVLLYRFLERYAPDPAIRQLVCLAYALGSMAMTYSMLYFSHQLAAICVASAWMIGLQCADRERRVWWFGVAGGLAGASALVDYQAVFAAVPATAHVIYKVRAWPRRELWKAIAIAAIAGAIPIAILLGYHAICFGSPLRTGYGAVAGDTFDASIAFASNHQEGFLGLTKLRWEAFAGSLWRLDNGLFALSPWLVIAIPGIVVLARGDRPTALDPATGWPAVRRRAVRDAAIGGGLIAIGVAVYLLDLVSFDGLVHPAIDLPILAGVAMLGVASARVMRGAERGTAVVAFSVLVIYVLFVSALKFWRGGWGVGPRYITAMLPFLLPPITAALVALQRWDRRMFGAVAGLIVVGVVIYTGATVTFPYWPDTVEGLPVLHPVFDIMAQLVTHDLVAPNLGSAIGIDGVLGIVPVIIVVAAAIGIAIHRCAGTTGLGCAIGVAVLLLAGYRLLPSPDRNAARSFEAARAYVEPLAWDVRVFCRGRDWSLAGSREVLFGFWRGAFSTTAIEPAITAFEHGTLDLAGLERTVHDAMARVDVTSCPTLEWLKTRRP